MSRRSLAPAARKALGAYYTPPALVDAALSMLPEQSGSLADLACGEGVWLLAAARRWPSVQLFGVDLDGAALAVARSRVAGRAQLIEGDGTVVRPAPVAGFAGGPQISGAIPPSFDTIVGNPPWGAGRIGHVRRGDESVSRFIDAALERLRPGGHLCLLLPAAWLEVAAHAAARRRLMDAAALERVQPLGQVFAGVNAPAALLVARREPDAATRATQRVETPAGQVAQATFVRDDQGVINARLSPRQHALVRTLESVEGRLAGRARFILGVVTGDNRRALTLDGAPTTGGDSGAGEPIVSGTDVLAMRIAPPKRRLALPLERLQQSAPRAAYARHKIVYRFVHAHPLAAVDREGRLTLNSANAFALEDDTLELDFVAAWLNSAPVRWMHRARYAMPRVLRSHLERLPLPELSRAQQRAVARAALDGDDARRDRLIMDAFALDDDARAQVTAWPRS